MSEVDEVSAGLGKEVRAVFAAALALAQLAAQRHASQVREQAARTGEAEVEARRRFGAEQRMAALGIPAPQTGMDPREVATEWAKAEAARAHAPEVADVWDRKAREVGVDPDAVRDQWWRQQEQAGRARAERPEVFNTALAGLGMETAGAIADADRAQAEDLEQGARREQDAAAAHTRDVAGADRDAAQAQPGSEQQHDATANAVSSERDAGTHHDRADNLHVGAEDLRAHAEDVEEAGPPAGAETVPAQPGVWQDGHPPARLAGKAYGVELGRGTRTAKQRGRSNGRAMTAARQREHGLGR